MKKLNDVALKLLAKAAYANAEKEANSACLFIEIGRASCRERV